MPKSANVKRFNRNQMLWNICRLIKKRKQKCVVLLNAKTIITWHPKLRAVEDRGASWKKCSTALCWEGTYFTPEHSRTRALRGVVKGSGARAPGLAGGPLMIRFQESEWAEGQEPVALWKLECPKLTIVWVDCQQSHCARTDTINLL